MTNQEPALPAPKGWPRISSGITYLDADAAITWLCQAFGFTVRLKIDGEDGAVEHSELTYGDGVIMVGDLRKLTKFPQTRAPGQIEGGNTQTMMVYVDDVDAHCARARAHGATIVKEPETTNYGEEYWTDRGYGCVDLGGRLWWFQQRLRTA